MILGIDHLSLSVDSLDKGRDYFIRSGWQLVFMEENLENSAHKRPLLQHYQETHDIALYKSSMAGMAFEVTSQGTIDNRKIAAYRPMLSGVLDGIQTREPNEHESRQLSLFEQMGLQNITPIRWLPFSVDAWHQKDCEKNLVTLSAAELERESHFWQQALGWNLVQSCSRGAQLRLNSPIAAWSCELLITENEFGSEYTLDAQGFPCLAMYTNALSEDLQHASQCGARLITEPFMLQVDGKNLDIALFRTPGMAICELIQVVSKKG